MPSPSGRIEPRARFNMGRHCEASHGPSREGEQEAQDPRAKIEMPPIRGSGPDDFASTSWSVVLAARDRTDPRAREAMAELYQVYWGRLPSWQSSNCSPWSRLPQ